jgi:hypothetical protein
VNAPLTTPDRPQVFCGIDWAEDHHDVALIDADGHLLANSGEPGSAPYTAVRQQPSISHISPGERGCTPMNETQTETLQRHAHLVPQTPN